jgi:hypothetical protein
MLPIDRVYTRDVTAALLATWADYDAGMLESS